MKLNRIVFWTILILLSANCTKKEGVPEPAPVKKYKIKINTLPFDGGNTSLANAVREEGETVSVTATPSDGFLFDGWTGDITSDANPLVFTITSDVSLTANFHPEKYLLVSDLPEDNEAALPSGGRASLLFTAYDSWTAEVTQGSDWLSIDAGSGEQGDRTLALKTLANEGGRREGKVTISCAGERVEVVLSQSPRIMTLTPVVSRSLTNAVTLTIDKPSAITRLVMIMPKPQTNIYQTISSLNVSGDVKEIENAPNVAYCFDSGTISSKNVGISIDYDITSNAITTDFTLIDRIPEYDRQSALYLSNTGRYSYDNVLYIDPQNPTIGSVAEELWTASGGDIIVFVRKASTWTATNIPYGDMNTGLHSISDILSRGGDCGNQASVFISILRAKGIPARHVVLVRTGSVHVRAEFYLPSYGWIPADPNGEQSYPELDWIGQVVYDYNTTIVSFGLTEPFNVNASRFNPVLFQVGSFWYWCNSDCNVTFSFSCTQR